MQKMLSKKREESKILPAYGASVRACAARRRRTAARRRARVRAAAFSVLGALEWRKKETRRRLNVEGGERFAPSPLFINGRRRSCARDLLHTISVTDGK